MDIKARMPGKVLEVKVKEGDTVALKSVLAVVESMKMQQPVPCPQEGVVKEVRIQVGDKIKSGDVLFVIG